MSAVFFALAALALSPVLLVVVVVQLVLAHRSSRLGVVPRDEDVVVRGTLRTWRVPWSDVDRFEVGGWRLPWKPPCGVLLRRGGSQITILALNPTEITEHAELDRILDELNGLARARRASS